jgi:hypothetical protein
MAKKTKSKVLEVMSIDNRISVVESDVSVKLETVNNIYSQEGDCNVNIAAQDIFAWDTTEQEEEASNTQNVLDKLAWNARSDHSRIENIQTNFVKTVNNKSVASPGNNVTVGSDDLVYKSTGESLTSALDKRAIKVNDANTDSQLQIRFGSCNMYHTIQEGMDYPYMKPVGGGAEKTSERFNRSLASINGVTPLQDKDFATNVDMPRIDIVGGDNVTVSSNPTTATITISSTGGGGGGGVQEVNQIAPDGSGNVEITGASIAVDPSDSRNLDDAIHALDEAMEDVVKTVNSTQPDYNGNVTLDGENINATYYPDGTHPISTDIDTIIRAIDTQMQLMRAEAIRGIKINGQDILYPDQNNGAVGFKSPNGSILLESDGHDINISAPGSVPPTPYTTKHTQTLLSYIREGLGDATLYNYLTHPLNVWGVPIQTYLCRHDTINSHPRVVSLKMFARWNEYTDNISLATGHGVGAFLLRTGNVGELDPDDSYYMRISVSANSRIRFEALDPNGQSDSTYVNYDQRTTEIDMLSWAGGFYAQEGILSFRFVTPTYYTEFDGYTNFTLQDIVILFSNIYITTEYFDS